MTTRSRKLRAGGALALVLALVFGVFAPAAMAQDPTTEQYGPGVIEETDGGGPVIQSSPPASPCGPGEVPIGTSGAGTNDPDGDGCVTASTLPFTGLDVGAFLAIGLGLIAAGLAVRRVARADGLA